MKASEVYEALDDHITTAIEILINLPPFIPDITSKAYEKNESLSWKLRSGLRTDQCLFTSQLYCLTREINRVEKLVIDNTSTKEGLSELLESFHSNKEKIVAYFESIIGHPELRKYYGWEQYYTFEGQLFNALRNVERESKRVQESFEKLILAIDSESQ